MEKKESARQIKREANSAKSKLIDLERQIRAYSKKDADSLEKIIFRLEAWQNR